jgi:hypothetical protein
VLIKFSAEVSRSRLRRNKQTINFVQPTPSPKLAGSLECDGDALSLHVDLELIIMQVTFEMERGIHE